MEQIPGTKSFAEKQSADIDVVALSEIDKTAIIGECKFKNEKIDKSIYETLLRRSSVIQGKYRVVKYLLFSLSGYTEWFNDKEDRSVLLLTLKDLYE